MFNIWSAPIRLARRLPSRISLLGRTSIYFLVLIFAIAIYVRVRGTLPTRNHKATESERAQMLDQCHKLIDFYFTEPQTLRISIREVGEQKRQIEVLTDASPGGQLIAKISIEFDENAKLRSVVLSRKKTDFLSRPTFWLSEAFESHLVSSRLSLTDQDFDLETIDVQTSGSLTDRSCSLLVKRYGRPRQSHFSIHLDKNGLVSSFYGGR